MARPEPYDETPKPAGLYDTVLNGLRGFNSGATAIIGWAFVLVGIALLISAAIIREPFLVPAGLLTIVLGGARLLLARRR